MPSIFRNKYLLICLMLLVVYQSIRAFSTYFLAKLIQDIARGESFVVAMVGFMGSIVLPYLPWVWARRYLILADHQLMRSVIEAYAQNHWNQPSQWSDRALRDEQNAFISKEARDLIRQTIVYVFDGVSLATDFLLSLIVLVYVSDSRLLWGYAGAGFLLIFAIRPINRVISRLASQLQNDQVRFDGHVQGSWDNIVLGNNLNFQMWSKAFDKFFQAYRDADVHLVTVQEAATSGLSALAIVLIFITNFWLAIHHQDPILVGVLAATLPKQIAMLQSLRSISYYVTSYGSLAARFIGLQRILRRLPVSDVSSRVALERIEFRHSEKGVLHVASIDDLLEQVGTSAGRLTIRGPNGTGKSTVLQILKDRLANKAYYLPAHHQLFFDGLDADASTGQATLRQLSLIQQDSQIKVLLLDEWDANLDQKNRTAQDQKIKELSHYISVIEVTHREQSENQAFDS